MILLTLVFKLGVRFAIFNFIWYFLELAHKMLTGTRPPFLAEHYILKALKYIFLVSITFSYCLEFAPNEPVYVLNWQKLLPGGLILMLYLLGKFKKQQEQIQFLAGFQLPMQQKPYSKNLEIALLVLSALTFTGLYLNPSLTEIVILNWFESNMSSLEKAFLLGFIFRNGSWTCHSFLTRSALGLGLFSGGMASAFACWKGFTQKCVACSEKIFSFHVCSLVCFLLPALRLLCHLDLG